MKTPMRNGVAPIGVFDSGLGGLSVVDAIRHRLPRESIIYIADSKYAPYGEKPDDFITARSHTLTEWLVCGNAKLLVVACNTATTHAISHLREQFKIPIVGVEPGIKPGAQTSVSGIVGVLATAATLRSQRFQMLLSEHGHACRFVCRAGHGLVELIEQGELEGPVVEALLERYLTPMVAEGADTLVLGSTHYAFLIPSIRRVFGSEFRLIETAAAIAKRVEHQLTTHQLDQDIDTADAVLRLFSTASSAQSRTRLAQLARMLSLAAYEVAAIDVE